MHLGVRHRGQYFLQLVGLQRAQRPAEHHMRHAAGRLGGQQIGQRRAHHMHRRQLHIEALADLLDQPGQRLAAVAALLGRVWAEKGGIEAAALFGQQLVQPQVHRVQRGHVQQATADAGLVGGQHRVPAGMVEPRDGFHRAGQRVQLLGRLDMVHPVAVERAVAAEDDQLHAVGVIGAQIGHGSARQLGQVGDPVHRRMQPAEQCQPVGPQRRVFGIDHHAVEEGVDRGLERGQGLQRCGVVVLLEQAVSLRLHLGNRRGQGLLGSLGQQRRLNLGGQLAVDLLQDVADALVGGGQRRGLGQGRKGPHRLQALGHVTQARGRQRQHGLDLLGAVALVAQGHGQAVSEEGQQRFTRVGDQLAKRRHGRIDQRRQLQRQVLLDQDADHAQRVAA
mmetsp:Transcript_53307/g.125306  ORF Transcript_53307/g.125306 Transcript_53307/m.125306 type:complete len:392 (+) Transcript_53307:3874-5049(+)